MKCHCEHINHDASPSKACDNVLGDDAICADYVGNVCGECRTACEMDLYMILPFATDEDAGIYAFTVMGRAKAVLGEMFPAVLERTNPTGWEDEVVVPMTFAQYDALKARMEEEK